MSLQNIFKLKVSLFIIFAETTLKNIYLILICTDMNAPGNLDKDAVQNRQPRVYLLKHVMLINPLLTVLYCQPG